MKTKTKIATAAAATLVAGAAIYVLPATAHDRGGNFNPSGAHFGTSSSSPALPMHEEFDHVTASATITGIPTTVTSSHEASHGAYFTAYVLEDTATSVPSSEPTTGGRRIGVMPERNTDGTFTDVLTGSTLTGVLGFHADSDGTTKLALYPSDGTEPILVTITTDDDGNVSAVASKSLTVAYSETVAAEAPVKGPRGDKGMGRGGDHGGKRGGHSPRGGHGMHDESGEMGNGQMFSSEDITPNA